MRHSSSKQGCRCSMWINRRGDSNDWFHLPQPFTHSGCNVFKNTKPLAYRKGKEGRKGSIRVLSLRWLGWMALPPDMYVAWNQWNQRFSDFMSVDKGWTGQPADPWHSKVARPPTAMLLPLLHLNKLVWTELEGVEFERHLCLHCTICSLL